MQAKLGNLGALQSGSVWYRLSYHAPSWEISVQNSSAVHRAKEDLATLSMVQTAPMYFEMLLAGSLLHLLLYTYFKEGANLERSGFTSLVLKKYARLMAYAQTF